jgi:hypothetical protein
LEISRGAVGELIDVGYWPKCEVPTDPEMSAVGS